MEGRSDAARALALGFATGLRSMTPAALLALRRGRPLLGGALALAALGELVVDKLPAVPARVTLAPAAARAFVGACVGAAAPRAGLSTIAGATLGLLGALAGTWLGFAARRGANRYAPDVVVAIGEDLVTLAISAWGTKRR